MNAFNVNETLEFFSAHPKIHHALALMRAVDLGYPTLGQPSPTLLGDETRRLKLVAKLAKARGRSCVAGRSVILIEHNLDLIAECDFIIDLDPDGDNAGGRLVAQDPPEKLVRTHRRSETARVLRGFLAARAVN